MTVSTSKAHRGFAAMDPAKQRLIASKGGKAAHAKGRAHEWTAPEASAAGLKGAVASHKARALRRGLTTPPGLK